MKKRPLLIYMILLLLAVTAVYSNHFHNGFHFDDTHSIVDNPSIRSLKNVPSFFADGTTSSVLPQNQAYRPVVTTSLAVDYALGNGYDLFAFHFITFLLFLLQGLAMYVLYKKLLGVSSGSTYTPYVALLAVAWYMLHPAIAETVNYIIARSDVQSTLAVLLAFVLYIRSPFCRKTFLYLLPIAIGTLAKPPSVMFAPLFFFYVLFFEQNTGLTAVFKKEGLKQFRDSLVKCIPAFIFCGAMYLAVSRLTPKTWEPGGNSPLQYLITQPFVILHYFGTFFWPTGLSADSDWGILPGVKDVRFIVGVAFILVMAALAVYTSAKQVLRPISFGIIWFFLALVPTSSIIPLGEVLNDHRMYFPFIGLALSVSWTLALMVLKFIDAGKPLSGSYKMLLLLPVLLLLCACAYGTWKRNQVWHDEESLWRNVTLKSPGNGRGMMNYGLIKLTGGNYAAADKYFNKALLLTPTYSFVYINLGVLKEKTGDYAAAESNFIRGIQLGGSYASHYYLYGQFLYHRDRMIEAEVMLQKAVDISASYLNSREILMNTYMLLGQWNQLKALALGTLKIDPNDAGALQALAESKEQKTRADLQADKTRLEPTAQNYLTLGLDYYNEGKYEQCIAASRQAIKIKSAYADAYNNIGCAYNAMEQFDQSSEAFKMALSINPNYELAKNNLPLSQAHRYISPDAISARPCTEDDYINQGLYYYQQRQYELCVAASFSALAINANSDLAYNNLCAAYVKLGQWNQAILTGEKGLKINPNNLLLRNNLAEAQSGKKAGAR